MLAHAVAKDDTNVLASTTAPVTSELQPGILHLKSLFITSATESKKSFRPIPKQIINDHLLCLFMSVSCSESSVRRITNLVAELDFLSIFDVYLST